MPDVKYTIVIKKPTSSGNDNTSNSPSGASPSDKPLAKKEAKSRFDFSDFLTWELAKKVGMDLLNTTASKVETYTGDSMLQRNLNVAFKVAGYGVAFAVNPALASVSLAFDIGNTMFDLGYQRKWENKSLANTMNLLEGYSYGRGRNRELK